MTKPKPPRSIFLQPKTLARLAEALGIQSPFTPERQAELKRERILKGKAQYRERTKKKVARAVKKERSLARTKRSHGRIPGWEFVQMMEDVEAAPIDKLKEMQNYMRKNEDSFRLSRLQRARILMRISARLRLCWKRALLA